MRGGANLYRYAGGDPINRNDPFGLCDRDREGRPLPGCDAHGPDTGERRAMMAALNSVLGGSKCQGLKDYIYDKIIDGEVFVYHNDDSPPNGRLTGDHHPVNDVIDINWSQRGSNTLLAYTLIHEASHSMNKDSPAKGENPRAKQDGIDCVPGAAELFQGGQ